MATITKIEQQKNKKRVNVFIDGDFFCGLLTETAVLFGLKVGVQVDENTLKKAIFESEVKSAFFKASDLISSRMHSSKELFNKLIARDYEKSIIDEVLRRLQDYGYIDDESFAREFVRQNNKYPRKIIENKLFAKGIEKNIINNVLKDINSDVEFEYCKKFADKYIKTHDSSKSDFKRKLYMSLTNKGFDFETIKKVMKTLDYSSDFE